MIRKFLLAAAASAVCLTAIANPSTSPATSVAASAGTSSFTPAQKKEIEKIIHSYLVENPQVMVEVVKALQVKQQAQMAEKAGAGIKQNAQALFNDASNPVLGNPNGTVTLVEFFDYQCPHCKENAVAVKNLIAQNKNLKVIFKELPIFPGSDVIAAAALASQKQGKFAGFHEALMAASNPMSEPQVMDIAKQQGLNVDQLKKDMSDPSIRAQLENNMKLANSIGIMGTPAFIFAANTQNADKLFHIFIPGGAAQDALQQALDQTAKHVK